MSFLDSCTLFEASAADVNSAFRDLSRGMDPDFSHMFHDKLERYARKPDRALFLISHNASLIAFATIIDRAPVPDELGELLRVELNSYACGTGLMVLPEFRKKGVASLLVKEWTIWTRNNGLPGIWIVTRMMAEWYQNHFSYLQVAHIYQQEVMKTVLAKKIPSLE
jgi:GNAT superfamily N-acetyltransferase